jgi:hypothetical protein
MNNEPELKQKYIDKQTEQLLLQLNLNIDFL